MRRKTGWVPGPRQVPTDLSAAGATIWAIGLQVGVPGETIVRIHGEWTIGLITVTAAQDGFASIGVGMCLVSDNAFGIGITAVPHPITDMSWDGWMYHSIRGSLSGFSTTEAGQSPLEAFRAEIDSKAMRKVRDTDVLIGVVELGSETGTAVAQFSAATRFLSKLP